MADLNISVSDSVGAQEGASLQYENLFVGVSDSLLLADYMVNRRVRVSPRGTKNNHAIFPVRYVVYPGSSFPAWMRFVPYCDVRTGFPVRYVVYCDEREGRMCWYFVHEDLGVPQERAWTQVRFMHDNLWDKGTLTASSEQDEFPAANTQHRWHHKTWRSENVTGSEWLKVDLGSAQDVRCFILKHHWFLPSATVRIQANTTDSWSSPPLDVSLEVCEPLIPIVKFWDAAKSYRWWRVLMTADYDNLEFRGDKDAVPYCSKFFRVGRVYLGDWWTPSKNFADAHVLAEVDESRKFVTSAGQTAVYKVVKYKKASYVFRFMTESDVALFKTMFDAVGTSVPLFICENEQYWWRQTYYCLLLDGIEVAYEGNNLYTVTLSLETMR